jgi:hypothetical protein
MVFLSGGADGLRRHGDGFDRGHRLPRMAATSGTPEEPLELLASHAAGVQQDDRDGPQRIGVPLAVP